MDLIYLLNQIKKHQGTKGLAITFCASEDDTKILNSVQSAFAKLGKRLHETVIISGIGCSSRFPYYMETFGFHTIHGRAPAIATGVKVANPDLDVWMITGAGDAMSIGGNHFIHLLRRNVGIKVLLFNNRIYGLTKGQYSPTSEQGKKTKSTPMGSIDHPMSPVNLALGAGATFIGRSIDTFGAHLENVIMRAAAHEGTALVEIYQNCNIFNDGAFDSFREKAVRDERTVQLEHGKPVIFGADSNRGLRLNQDLRAEAVTIGENGVTEADVMVWDETDDNPARAMALASMPEATFPVPVGIFRNTSRPAFEDEVHAQVQSAQQARGDQSLQDLLNGPDPYTI